MLDVPTDVSGGPPDGPAPEPQDPRAGAGRRAPLATRASADADGLLRQRGLDVGRRLSQRERRVEYAMTALFLAVAAVMATAWTATWRDPLDAVLLVATYALVARVRFQVGPGLVRPTELVLVPMLLLLPAPFVPGLVAAGSVLSELPAVARRRAHPERALVAISASWHAVGPAVVVWLLAPEQPTRAAASVYLLALLAQFGVDFVASTVRAWLGAGTNPRVLAPVLAIGYVADALLAPIGFLAVLASRVHPQAYLLAAAPGALLALIARERAERTEQELTLGRAYRRSTRLLDGQAAELRTQAAQLERARRSVGTAVASTLDRGALERLLLNTTIETVRADCGRLTTRRDDGTFVERLASGGSARYAEALHAAEAALLSRPSLHEIRVGDITAVAIPLGSQPLQRSQVQCLTVGRAGGAFSIQERELLEHLAVQAAVSLENLRLHELMRKTEAEVRAILEGVADSVFAENPAGDLVYLNAAAVHLLGYERTHDPLNAPVSDLIARLEVTDERGQAVPAAQLPGRRALDGEQPPPLVVRYRRAANGEPRCARMKATPVFDERGHARLAITVIEDITEIKQAEEAQRFLAESSRLLAGSLDVEETLPAVARLAVPQIADGCAVHLAGERGLRSMAVIHSDAANQAIAEALSREYAAGPRDEHGAAMVIATGRSEVLEEIPDEVLRSAARDERHLGLLRSLGMVSTMTVPMRARENIVGAITLVSAGSGRRFGPLDLALAEDLGLRAGTAVDNARLYRTRSAIAQTLQASLLPPVLPRIPHVETAALYRAAGEGHEVGGDFYDLFSTQTDQWFVVMGDVCGKGAEAAAVTALARYTIRAAVVRHRSPAGILRWVNDAMLRQSMDSRFATIACARLDLEPDGISATGASGGHPCPRILRATGLVEQLGVPGTLLGAVRHVRIEERTTRLARGDALVFYTDGLTEAGAPRRVWSPTQLDAAVAGARHQPAQGIVDHLATKALDEAEGPLRDDLALLAVRAV
jgi:PAS domain S-box-containing protein